jgi:hypothetical protein
MDLLDIDFYLVFSLSAKWEMETKRDLVGNQTFNHTVIQAFRSWNPGSRAN